MFIDRLGRRCAGSRKGRGGTLTPRFGRRSLEVRVVVSRRESSQGEQAPVVDDVSLHTRSRSITASCCTAPIIGAFKTKPGTLPRNVAWPPCRRGSRCHYCAHSLLLIVLFIMSSRASVQEATSDNSGVGDADVFLKSTRRSSRAAEERQSRSPAEWSRSDASDATNERRSTLRNS